MWPFQLEVSIEPDEGQCAMQNFRDGGFYFGHLADLAMIDKMGRNHNSRGEYTKRPSGRGYEELCAANKVEVTADQQLVLKNQEGQVTATYELLEEAEPHVLGSLLKADMFCKDPDTVHLNYGRDGQKVQLSIDNRGPPVAGYSSTRNATFSLHIKLECFNGMQKLQKDMRWTVPRDGRQVLWEFLDLRASPIWDEVSQALHGMYVDSCENNVLWALMKRQEWGIGAQGVKVTATPLQSCKQ